MKNKLKIQIWSDVVCPFCYIGKRKLEHALEQFEHKDNVEVEWKSFQLDPDASFESNTDLTEYLANKYGRDRQWAESMQANVTNLAKDVGLEYHLDKAVRINSFHAHRLAHLAKKYNLGDAFEELLFKAYFTDGANIADKETLMQLALETGLAKEEIETVLNSEAYSQDVKQDIAESQSLGITGVPFFVFDEKYAVSGAQHSETFLNALQKTWTDGNFDSETSNENSCDIDGCS